MADIDRQLGRAARRGPGGIGPPRTGRSAPVAVESLEAQRAAADRLDRVIDAQTELRLLDARLDEAVARTLELSAQPAPDADVPVVDGPAPPTSTAW